MVFSILSQGHIVLLLLIAATTIYVFQRLLSSSNRKRLPPGPSGSPFVGNIFQVPIHKPWLYFEELGRIYGPIVHIKLGFEEIVVLNKASDAEELLNERSKIYSSRRPQIYAGKYLTDNKPLVLSKYGEEWRKLRAAYNAMFQTRAMHRYTLLTELESTKLVLKLLDTHLDEDWTTCIMRFTASIIYAIVYGKRLEDESKDFDEIIAIVTSFVKDCYPGAHLVDTFTFLDSLPDLLAPWRKEALRKRDWQMSFFARLAGEVKKATEAHAAPACFTSYLMEKKDFDDVTIAEATGEMFLGGTDTTASTIIWFFMAMLLNPDTLRKAQSEIDGIVGSDGTVLPCMHHLKDLPYCVAILKETFRWMPVIPGGFPHYSDEHDIYKGYSIQAKTMVIPNIWAMHRNEEQFPNSSKFIPERYLGEGQSTVPTLSNLTDGHFGFGFGRRICPGKNFAAQTTWIAITRIMWACNLDYAKTSDGQRIPVDPNHSTSQIMSRPLSFPLVITPRSQIHKNTLEADWGRLKDVSVFSFNAID